MERYRNYNTVLKQEFGERIQKISINAGFTCPNRDGSKGRGGCTYCNNLTFSPEYCRPVKSVLQQVEEGIDFFRYKYKSQYYFAYFQSYTNTYADLPRLKALYEEALSHPLVEGLVVGTRPDCVSDELLDYFSELSRDYYVMVEYGVESTHDDTLRRINRQHDYACSVEAIHRTVARGIRVGAHLILGLPGESREMILHHADELSELPLTALKLHQLQLIKGTVMAKEYEEHPEAFHLYTADEYVELAVDFLERLHPDIAVERFISQSPADLLLAPDWGIKNFEFVDKVRHALARRDTYQGRLYAAQVG